MLLSTEDADDFSSALLGFLRQDVAYNVGTLASLWVIPASTNPQLLNHLRTTGKTFDSVSAFCRYQWVFVILFMPPGHPTAHIGLWGCLRIVRYLGALAGFDRVRKTDRIGIRYRLSVACEECELLSRSQVRECIPLISYTWLNWQLDQSFSLTS